MTDAPINPQLELEGWSIASAVIRGGEHVDKEIIERLGGAFVESTKLAGEVTYGCQARTTRYKTRCGQDARYVVLWERRPEGGKLVCGRHVASVSEKHLKEGAVFAAVLLLNHSREGKWREE